MRLLHILTTLDVGGAEMHVLHQVRGQCRRGHSVRVLYLKGEGTLAPDFEAAGAEEVRRVPLGPLFPLRVRRDVREADLVHSHLLKADVAAAGAALLLGARGKLVSGKHNDERALLSPLFGRIHGLLGRIPARTIVLSDHVGRFVAEYGRVPLARQSRVYYGLDRAPFEAAAEERARHRAEVRDELGLGVDDVVFVCVARFAPQKAHEVLIRAAARAHARDAAVQLLLVGDDPFGDGRQRAEAVAEELGVRGGVVHFAGIRRDVPRLMAASDAFVMASRWEGLGLVFLEAMATSLPVLSTRVSAIPEVVVDGETGVLVPPDDAGALADAMVALAGDEERRAALGRAGHARVARRFGLDRMVDETLAIYREVLGRPAAGRAGPPRAPSVSAPPDGGRLGPALNEARLVALELDEGAARLELRLDVLALRPDAVEPPDRRRTLRLEGVERVRAVVRPGGPTAPPVPLASFAALSDLVADLGAGTELLGDDFIDDPEVVEDWPATSSLDRPLDAAGDAAHTLSWSLDAVRRGGARVALAVLVDFARLAMFDADGEHIEPRCVADDAERFWTSLKAGEDIALSARDGGRRWRRDDGDLA